MIETEQQEVIEEERTVYERINNEPVIFRGLSSSELGTGLVATVITLLPICGFIGYLMDRILVGFAMIGVLTILSMMYMGTVFQWIKRGRPDGYYQQRTALFLSQLGLRSSPAVKYNGRWSNGRTDPNME
jgi:conjugative transfer region protein (TIGR03750 family)